MSFSVSRSMHFISVFERSAKNDNRGHTSGCSCDTSLGKGMPHEPISQPPAPPPLPPPIPPESPRHNSSLNGRALENAKSLVRKNLIGIQERKQRENDDSNNTVRSLLAVLQAQPNNALSQAADGTIYLSFYRHVPPIVQDGPSCGLAALCMALSLLYNSALKLHEVLDVARKLGFTKMGEMFSASNLLLLAEHLVSCTGYLISREIDADEKAAIIAKELQQQNIVLIPYDKDSNHEPCLKRGQRAHWALLTGLFVLGDPRASQHFLENKHFVRDDMLPELFHLTQDGLEQLNLKTSDEFDAKYVYACHGQSLRCRLWSLHDLLASNGQLVMLSPEMAASPGDYIIPCDGVESGLCGQVVILKKSS